MFLSILESLRHELRIVYGFTLVNPSLCGREAFPTPKALTHTMITWPLSPTVPQISGITPKSPRAQGVLGTPHGAMRDTEALDIETTTTIVTESRSMSLPRLPVVVATDSPNEELLLEIVTSLLLKTIS